MQNLFMVGSVQDDSAVIQVDVFRRPLRKEEAMNLAAWLVFCCGCTDEDFKQVVDAIRAL